MRIVDAIVIGVWRRNRKWLAAFVAIWLLALCIPPVRQLLLFDLFGSSLMWYQQAPLANSEANPTEEFTFKDLPAQDVSTRFATLMQPQYGYGQTAYQPSQVQMPLPAAVVKANNALFKPPPGAPTGPPPGLPPTAVVTPVLPALKPPRGNPQKEVDQLIQQYPREAWLIAYRLCQTLSWMQDNRFAGLYEWQPIRPMKIPAVIPEKRPCAPFFTPIHWEQAFAFAKQGQQLEPDNAFFDTVLIYLYLAAYRDNDALRVLATAIKKSQYDDHVFTIRRIFIGAHEKIRPLILEEKLDLRSSRWDSHNIDRIALLMSWQAWKWEQKGQKTEGLKLRHQIAQLGHLMQLSRLRGEANYPGLSLTTKAYNFDPWEKFATSQKPIKPQRSRLNLDAIHFANTARSLGLNNIASETLLMAEKSAHLIQIAQNDSSSQGLSEQDYYWMGGWHELRLAFLIQFALMLTASAVLGFFLLASYNAPPVKASIVASNGWSLAVVIVCAALFLYLTLQQKATFSSPLYGGINISLGACVIVPIIVGALYAWIGAKKQLRQLRRTDATLMEKRDIIAVGVSWCFFVTAFAAIICWGTAAYYLINTTPLTPTWTIPISFNGGPPPFSGIDPLSASSVCAVVLSGAIYVVWFLAWRFFTQKELQPLLHGALRQHRNALAAFALCSASLYVLAILLSLPHRNAMNQKFEDYLLGKPAQQIKVTDK